MKRNILIQGIQTFRKKKNALTFAFGSAGLLLLAPCSAATYQLTVIAGTGGVITAPTAQTVTVNQDSQTVITARPNSGYVFAEWIDTSTNAIIAYKNSISTKVKLPTSNAVIQARFIKITSALTPVDISAFQKENGANFSHYTGNWTTLPDFSTLIPDSSGSCDSLAIQAVPHQSNNLGIVFNGYFNVPADGNYTFYVKCNGGYSLLVNDSVIAKNTGLRTSVVVDSAVVALVSGAYVLELRYFNANTVPSLTVSSSSADVGLGKETINTDAITRPYSGPVPKITVIKPVGGEIYHLGDTIHVQWVYKNARGQTFASLTHDNGKSFANITALAFPGNVTTYDWKIPKDSVSYITTTAKIKVEEYPPYDKFGVSLPFTIVAGAGVKNPLVLSRGASASVKITASDLVVTGAKNKTVGDAVLINVNGETVARGNNASAYEQRVSIRSVPVGMYILSWHSEKATMSRFVTIAK